MFLSCFLCAVLILFVKIYMIPDFLEFIEPISIYASLLSSVIFIYGFMITPAVSEYKESERLKTELKSTIESIYSDIGYFKMLKPVIDIQWFFTLFGEILHLVFVRIADDKKTKDINELLNSTNKYLIDIENSWIAANHIIKLKQEISNFRKIISRLFFIKDNDSLPKVVHKLKNFITFFIIWTLFFVNIGNGIEDNLFTETKEWIVIFILSFIYIYLSLIISSLENPCNKRNFSWYIDINFLNTYQKVSDDWSYSKYY